jgi:hypothetical protein
MNNRKILFINNQIDGLINFTFINFYLPYILYNMLIKRNPYYKYLKEIYTVEPRLGYQLGMID